ncbi:MAG: hypothetical protein LKF43_00185 [Streptococcaceae bacterium]|jgi:hypothetical protein|nr:hypothetical protein [Streptococcaceae bacterium]
MTPVAEVCSECLPKIFPEINEDLFFPYKIPVDFLSFSKLPFFKVENVNESNSSFGSDKYNSRNYRLQVMVFINPLITDIEQMNDKIDRGLEKYGYVQVYGEDRPHSENENIHILIRQYTHTRRK